MEETNSRQPDPLTDTNSAAPGNRTGTVKNFDKNRRFGFITQEDGKEIFVHQEALLDGTTIAKGDRVSYQVVEGAKGLRAASVRKL